MERDLAFAYASGLLGRGLVSLPRPLQRALAGPVPEAAAGLDPGAWLLARAATLGERLAQNRPAPSIARGRELTAAQSRFMVPRPARAVHTEDLDLDGIPARRYAPHGALPGARLVFFHGGGWVNRDVQAHDPAVRNLADLSGVEIVSVEYRRAPEHPFPAAADDAFVAYRLLCQRFGDEKIAVGGDSAGGNLAASVAVTARDRGERVPDFQWLLYPAVDASRRYPSTDRFATGFYLTADAMDHYENLYMPTEALKREPRASPLLADARDLPPAYVAVSMADPLRDEAEAYAQKLRDAGIAATTQCFPQLHGFLNMTALRSAQAAVAVTAGALRAGLA
jgi:acetyl esterase